jgi:tRNA-2-methylthio-N6-dimethylallyladenosine synthase
VPHLRGPEKSRAADSIIATINKYVNLQEVVLLGQNVNAYGKDNNEVSFPELLEKISSQTKVPWIRFLTSHPKDFSQELIDAVATNPRVCKHIHLPLQSGSNQILQKMGRQYSQTQYLEIVAALKARVPDISLTTDLIVGFPGETDQDYQATIDVLHEVGFDDAYMYKYNPRPGTASYAQKEIPAAVKKERLSNLIEVQTQISKAQLIKKIGQQTTVLLEKQSKKNEAEIFGKTEKNYNVVAAVPQSYIGKIYHAQLQELTGKTFKAKILQEP